MCFSSLVRLKKLCPPFLMEDTASPLSVRAGTFSMLLNQCTSTYSDVFGLGSIEKKLEEILLERFQKCSLMV